MADDVTMDNLIDDEIGIIAIMMLDAEFGVIIGDVSEKLHDPVVYPAAILAEAPQADAAADFYTFMQSDFAKEIYGKYGFTVK